MHVDAAVLVLIASRPAAASAALSSEQRDLISQVVKRRLGLHADPVVVVLGVAAVVGTEGGGGGVTVSES